MFHGAAGEGGAGTAVVGEVSDDGDQDDDDYERRENGRLRPAHEESSFSGK